LDLQELIVQIAHAAGGALVGSAAQDLTTASTAPTSEATEAAAVDRPAIATAAPVALAPAAEVGTRRLASMLRNALRFDEAKGLLRRPRARPWWTTWAESARSREAGQREVGKGDRSLAPGEVPPAWFLALLTRLSPRHRALARLVAAELSDNHRRLWFAELASLPRTMALERVCRLVGAPPAQGGPRSDLGGATARAARAQQLAERFRAAAALRDKVAGGEALTTPGAPGATVAAPSVPPTPAPSLIS
jgi:hypothetical protein